MSAADGERIVRLVAHHVGAEVHAEKPRVSAELPKTGERFEGLLPPVVAAPAFAIRKPAVAVFTLGDYVAAGIMTAGQATALRDAVAGCKNILVAGGTSTGKTTLTNALLAEIAGTTDRVVLIEDTRELQCRAPNLVALRTKDGVASLSDLVRSSLRLRPDRFPIGEVRGAEALDLLKAWGQSQMFIFCSVNNAFSVSPTTDFLTASGDRSASGRSSQSRVHPPGVALMSPSMEMSIRVLSI
jgi:type IV secretion system protein TrbB